MATWYRTGTVAVTNGNATIVGTGTLWTLNASTGDIFIGPDLAQYEITAVTDDTHINVKTLAGVATYNGATLSNQVYAIIRNFTSTLSSQLAAQLTTLVTNWQTREDQFRSWHAGVVNGGPNFDGNYPLTDAVGVSQNIACPAKLQSLAGLTTKIPVKCATTANITLSGTQTIDTIAVNAGDRVLVKNQTTGSQNGIYVANAAAWTLASDFDISSKAVPACLIPVQQGGTLGMTIWQLTNTGTINLGTTALTFAQVYPDPNKAGLAGATFTGAVTATAFNGITALASATSPMNGAAAVGTSTTVARQDHVHPTDTSRCPVAGPGSSQSFTTGPLTVTGDLLVTGNINTYASNDIGVPGARGFGVGTCPAPPAGMSPMIGCFDTASDNYGNYQYADGSIMCWIPAFYYQYGTGANGLAINAVNIKPYSAYANVAAANAAGYALHRMFYDGGVVQTGVFVDKYICSNNGGTASSIRNGKPLSTDATHNPISGLTGAPPNFYYGAIAAAKTRGASFFCSSRFIQAGLALLALAHAQASSNTTYCAWYNATYNFPKGCNNNALGDQNDAALAFVSDGYSNCPKTGSANMFARTTHNGQNSGVADLNGCMWEITPGMATDDAGTTYYVLKTSAAMKSVTGGNTLATDLWGATGLAALYDSLGATYGAALASSTAKLYGSASQVLSGETSGLPWQAAGLGIPLVGGVGGTNLFGSDGFWDYRPAAMCPFSGGGWANDSGAGVWAFYLADVRGTSSSSVGFRSALYL